MRSCGFEEGEGEKEEKAGDNFGQARHGLIITIKRTQELKNSRTCLPAGRTQEL